MKVETVLLFFVAVTATAHCQLVEIGPPDLNHCKKLKVKPNLIIERYTNISGRLIDGSGAPFRDSQIALRLFLSPTKQKDIQTVKSDADGHFRIDAVKAGKYRLVASPTRAFQQPKSLRCVNEQCELNVTLEATPTEMPDYTCPVR